MSHPSPWFTREEAAEYLRVTVATIDRWVRDGTLVRQRIAGTRSVRFHIDALDKMIVSELTIPEEEDETP